VTPDAAPDPAVVAGNNPAASEGVRFEAQTAQRPDYIPEKFWRDGKPDIENLAKSYGELETRFTTKTETLLKNLDAERRKGLPEAPEKYEIALAEDIGITAEDIAGHPAIDFWRKTAFEAGLAPEKFNEGVAQIVGILTAGPDLEAEAKALGENAEARIGAVAQWVKASVTDPEEFAAVQMLGTSAAGIRALERLMGKGGAMNTDDLAPRPPRMTIEKLKAMQADQKYWSPVHRDPAWVKEVDEGFAALYGAR
jgi:hypothetical protein